MASALTSRSHPIEVHFVPSTELPLQGRIGFTLAPGRKGPGVAGMHDRDLDEDMERLRFHYDVNVLVSLVTEAEAQDRTRVSIDQERRAAEARGMVFHHLPVVAGKVPDDDALVDLVQLLRDQVELGRTVVVHDRAGGGRAATVVAALLIAQGHAVDSALGTVRGVRPKAVEPMQEKKLRAIGSRLAARSAPLLDVVVNTFDLNDWKYDRIQGATVLRSGFTRDGISVPLVLVTSERLEILTVFGLVRPTSPEESRAAVGELLHRVNWELGIGAFELDFADGEVRFRNSIDVEGGMLSDKMVGIMVNATVSVVARHQPLIEAVARGAMSPQMARAKPMMEVN